MSMQIANLTQKQIIISVISILVVCIILVLLGNMYGGFLKSQVAVPTGTNYNASGSVKSSVFQDTGAYTLQFQGQDAAGAQVEASTVFEIKP